MSDHDQFRIHLSLVSHTNIGKTTLARTLLMRDVGEVADRAHVTETTDDYVLARDSAGCELVLWDTRDSATPSRSPSALQVEATRSDGSSPKSGTA